MEAAFNKGWYNEAFHNKGSYQDMPSGMPRIVNRIRGFSPCNSTACAIF